MKQPEVVTSHHDHGMEAGGARGAAYGAPCGARLAGLRTLRCMQGIVSGGLLVVAFAAVAGLALLVAARLYWIRNDV